MRALRLRKAVSFIGMAAFYKPQREACKQQDWPTSTNPCFPLR